MSDKPKTLAERLTIALHERDEARSAVLRVQIMVDRLRREASGASDGVRQIAEKIAAEIERNLRGGL